MRSRSSAPFHRYWRSNKIEANTSQSAEVRLPCFVHPFVLSFFFVCRFAIKLIVNQYQYHHYLNPFLPLFSPNPYIISNAIKFSSRGEIILSASSRFLPPVDGTPQMIEVLFSVKDSGIGISEAAKRTLFQPFHQADTSVTRRYGGSGMYISIYNQHSRSIYHYLIVGFVSFPFLHLTPLHSSLFVFFLVYK